MAWLAQWLRDGLVRHGLRQAPVAVEVCVGEVTTSSILTQAHAPMVDTCLRLADYLGVSREEILPDRLPSACRCRDAISHGAVHPHRLPPPPRRPSAITLDELRGVGHCHPSPAMPHHPPDPHWRCPMQASQRLTTSSRHVCMGQSVPCAYDRGGSIGPFCARRR
jgi:hypothetical protein